jgi:hypothetical protein
MGECGYRTPCAITGKQYSVVVTLEGVIAYFTLRAHIADAFPELPREEREFLISGTSPEGWNKLFGRIERRGNSHEREKEEAPKHDGKPSLVAAKTQRGHTHQK